MKQVTSFFIAAILIFSCSILTSSPVDVDTANTATSDAIFAAAFQTAMARVNAAQTMTASVWTATYVPILSPTPTPPPTPTPSLTPSPFPAEIKTLLQDKCEMPWHQAIGNFAVKSPGLFEKYVDQGCRLPILSPNRKHLAYLTPDKTENQNVYTETVKILQASTRSAKNVYFAHDWSYIHNLEWSPTGDLIIQEIIWEGPIFVLIYDPINDSVATTMRLDPESKLKWNAGYTALYTEHSHDYGASTCIHELRGYDFAYGNPFPDFYEIFDIEKEEDGLLGIPNGKSDDIAVQPFAWSRDGRHLWLTITLLHKVQEGSYYEYEVGPKQAGVLELREEDVKLTMLASDPRYDYSFSESPGNTIVATPYEPHRCP